MCAMKTSIFEAQTIDGKSEITMPECDYPILYMGPYSGYVNKYPQMNIFLTWYTIIYHVTAPGIIYVLRYAIAEIKNQV